MKLVKKTFVTSAATDGSTIVNYANNETNTIFGSAGNDHVYGGTQRDLIRAGAGNDFVYGLAGNDSLKGDEGNDYVDGGEGNDWISGDAGNDTLVGGAGSDTFVFQINNSNATVNFGKDIGNDTAVDFQTGTDKIDVSSIFARFSDADVESIIASLTDIVAPKKVGVSYSGVEDAVATNGTVYGLNGDRYDFQISASTDFAKSKTVQLWIKNASDKTDVGATITLKNLAGLSATDFAREVTKIAHGTAGNDTLDYSALASDKGIKAYGFAGNDTITGTANNDILFGDGNDDVLNGGAGSDNLYGGSNADKLNGGTGDDFLYGGVNGATYAGSTGIDKLTGGDGSDTFILGGSVGGTADAPVFVFDQGYTVITDFKYGVDKLKIANTSGFSGDLANASLDFTVNDADLMSLLSKKGNDLYLVDGNAGFVVQNLFTATSGLTDTNHDGKLDMSDINSTVLHTMFAF